MGLKAINLRETHERPEADEEATVPVSGLDIDLISNQIIMQNKLDKPKNASEIGAPKLISPIGQTSKVKASCTDLAQLRNGSATIFIILLAWSEIHWSMSLIPSPNILKPFPNFSLKNYTKQNITI